MRKLEKPISKHFPPLRLYLDDVHAIYNILKKSCGGGVTVTTDNFEIKDMAKFNDVGPEDIHTLKFDAREPYISLELGRSDARLWMNIDSTLNKGIAAEIEEVLSRCYRKIARIFANSFLSAFIGTIIFLVPALFILFNIKGLLSVGLFILFLVLYGLSFFFAALFSLRRYSTIIFTERRGHKTFFSRNKDTILVGIISACVSAIFTAIITILVIKMAG